VSGSSFAVIVGRPWDRPAQQAEAAMRTRLRADAALWLRREAGASHAEAAGTADRIVADQLHGPGRRVVALTADQLRTYLRLTREATR
jgi:hypothetical protein